MASITVERRAGEEHDGDRVGTPRPRRDGARFDLSYHLRWIAAPEPKTLDTVVEYARQAAMSGLITTGRCGRSPWSRASTAEERRWW